MNGSPRHYVKNFGDDGYQISLRLLENPNWNPDIPYGPWPPWARQGGRSDAA